MSGNHLTLHRTVLKGSILGKYVLIGLITQINEQVPTQIQTNKTNSKETEKSE